jgi:hypothetical protein
MTKPDLIGAAVKPAMLAHQQRPVRAALLGHIRIAWIDHWVKSVFVLPGILVALPSSNSRHQASRPLLRSAAEKEERLIPIVAHPLSTSWLSISCQELVCTLADDMLSLAMFCPGRLHGYSIPWSRFHLVSCLASTYFLG